jgi:hypothetical protein
MRGSLIASHCRCCGHSHRRHLPGSGHPGLSNREKESRVAIADEFRIGSVCPVIAHRLADASLIDGERGRKVAIDVVGRGHHPPTSSGRTRSETQGPPNFCVFCICWV